MNLKQIQEQPVKVRVLDSTYSPSQKTRDMIGGEFEVSTIYYSDKTIAVWDKNKGVCIFNLSDVQFLTPLKIGDRYIAVGDVLENEEGDKYEVYGYYWDEGEWWINTAVDFDYGDTRDYGQDDINEIFKLSTQEDEISKAIKVLEKAGKIKDGKIITN